MNRFLFTLLVVGVILLHGASLLAQSTPFITYSIPLQPLHLQVNGSEIHVLCGQVDNNFNGTQDMGDIPASWVVLNANGTNTLRSRQFLWNEGVGFPSRPAWDFSSNTLYLAQSGRIRAFDTQTLAVKRDTVLLIDSLARSTFSTSGTVAGLSYSRVGIMGSDRLAIALRGRATSAVITLEISRNRILQRLPAGVFVQQGISYTTPVDGIETVVLNEGAFGTSTSTFSIYAGDNNVATLNLGDTGNHVFVFAGQAFVTMNGSHQVHVIDLATRRITRTIPTGTTGFNGPRESVVIGNTLYVTTYASDVRAFDLTTGREIARYNPRGKPEGIAALGNTIVVANAFESGGFNSANTVVVLNPATSIKNTLEQSRISVAPNPVQDRTTVRIQGVDGLNKQCTMTLVNALGKQIAILTPTFTSTTSIEAVLEADELGLAQGMYFVHVRTEQGTTSVPVRVVR